MNTIRWEFYPHVAENPHARAWLETQGLLGLAQSTIHAYGRGANDYLAFCQRTTRPVVEATKADIVAYIDEMTHQANPKGDHIRYLYHRGAAARVRTPARASLQAPGLQPAGVGLCGRSGQWFHTGHLAIDHPALPDSHQGEPVLPPTASIDNGIEAQVERLGAFFKTNMALEYESLPR